MVEAGTPGRGPSWSKLGREEVPGNLRTGLWRSSNWTPHRGCVKPGRNLEKQCSTKERCVRRLRAGARYEQHAEMAAFSWVGRQLPWTQGTAPSHEQSTHCAAGVTKMFLICCFDCTSILQLSEAGVRLVPLCGMLSPTYDCTPGMAAPHGGPVMVRRFYSSGPGPGAPT